MRRRNGCQSRATVRLIPRAQRAPPQHQPARVSPSSRHHNATAGTLTRPPHAQADSPADGSPRPSAPTLRASLRRRGAPCPPSRGRERPRPLALRTRHETAAAPLRGPGPVATRLRTPARRPRIAPSAPLPALRSGAAVRVPPTARPSRCQRPRPQTNSSGRDGAAALRVAKRSRRPPAPTRPANKERRPPLPPVAPPRRTLPRLALGGELLPAAPAQSAVAAVTENARAPNANAHRPPRHPSCQTPRWRWRARRARGRRHCAGPASASVVSTSLVGSSLRPSRVPRRGRPCGQTLSRWLLPAPRITGDYIQWRHDPRLPSKCSVRPGRSPLPPSEHVGSGIWT